MQITKAGEMSEQRQTHRAQSRRTTAETALAAYVARAVRLHPDEILSITLYGSQARGDAKTESDIDVLVVVRRDSSALRQALTDLAWQVQFEYGVVISDIIRSIEQFNRMRANRFPFYQNIEREGVLLWKSTSEPTPIYA
jgi:predicted nucleotidyltransferase